jgi:glutamate racemase
MLIAMDNRPIGFFDSGVGGLSILAEVNRILPGENLLYVADSAHFPYGALTAGRLRSLAAALSRFLLDLDAKMIVVSCNTATVHALAFLRQAFPGTPFVGVVPVIKTLAERSQTGVIGLLSTPSTAQSAYLADLVRQFASGMRVINVPCDGLADLVEAGNPDDPPLEPLLRQCLAPVIDGGADVVGLGCTHFPFLRDDIERILAGRATVYDSSIPVARRVREVLADSEALANVTDPRHRLFTSGDQYRFDVAVRAHLRSRATLLSHTVVGACAPLLD